MNGKNFVNMICSSSNIEQYKSELEKTSNKISQTLELRNADDHLKFKILGMEQINNSLKIY